MKISKYKFGLLLASLLLTACSTPPVYQILGASTGWDANQVTVLSDIQVNSLKVRHVRLKNDLCQDGYVDHLELSGQIGSDSSEVVARVLEKVTLCVDKNTGGRSATAVFLNATGDITDYGYKLGQTFRTFSVATFITAGQICDSSCAIAFLGGTFRSMKGNGKLGFRFRNWDNQLRMPGDPNYFSCPSGKQSKEWYDYVTSYLDTKSSQFLFNKTMTFCSLNSEWVISADAANLFGITTN